LYLSYLLPGFAGLSRWAPVALIAILTFINYRGIKGGAFVQVLFTILKIGGLAVLIGSAFFYKSGPVIDWTASASAISVHGVGLAMLGCFVAYDGWHVIAFVAGEVREPRRNLPLALGLGLLVSVAIYVLANMAYMRLLPLPDIAASQRVAATAAERSMGAIGATLMTLTIVLSSIGSANGSILTAPRIYFAQARDGLFFRQLARVHPKYETPHISILVQGVWTSLLALSGSYEALFSYVIFASWVVHAMTVLAVLILRRKRPDVPRPYRMWGYPVAPLLFVAFALAFVVNTLVGRPGSSVMGALIILSGVPVFYLWKSKA
jgi:basic amino acid/polyamine antiporter, APA family